MTKKSPHPVDVYVGRRLRLRRTLLGLSQTAVAKQLGLSFQQLQKYENGTNRIGAGRLHDLAEILKVPVSFFYDGVADSRPPAPEVGGRALEAAWRLERIADSEKRRAIFRLIAALSSVEAE